MYDLGSFNFEQRSTYAFMTMDEIMSVMTLTWQGFTAFQMLKDKAPAIAAT